LYNENLLFADKKFFISLFNTLKKEPTYLNFGSNKVIFPIGIIDHVQFSIHRNVLISNNTTSDKYYNTIEKEVKEFYISTESYPIESVFFIKVRVWNMDLISNSNIKISRTTIPLNDRVGNKYNNTITKSINKPSNFKSFSTLHPVNLGKRFYHISPLKKKNKIPDTISTLDIETVEYNNIQIPIAITLAYDFNKTKLFLINHKLISDIQINLDKAVSLLWKQCFDFILKNKNSSYFKTIYSHNLGKFDGIFIYKALLNFDNLENVSSLIDHENKFIQITWYNNKIHAPEHKIIFKDSLRLFPVKLNKLCEAFNVQGKFSEYNKHFNNINLFKDPKLFNEFKLYAIQDSLCLLKTLLVAQDIYLKDYNVDITTIISTSTLSLKIFRLKFLDTIIPVLKNSVDYYVRKSYFGGATDYYKAYVKDLHYYDVNSLYPFAMLKPMPCNVIKYHPDLSNTKIDNFFGFCLAEIITPTNIKKPLLPYKHEGRTIYPTGSWIGVYFSEELKAVQKYGYNINLINGYEFDKQYIFKDYIDHFYNKKKISEIEGDYTKRYIAKLHLNLLYGIFGRKLNTITTINVKNEDIIKYVSSQFSDNKIYSRN
jgi:hypothetical protein